jgi:hypothetical protein
VSSGLIILFYALTPTQLRLFLTKPPEQVKDTRQNAPKNATVCKFDMSLQWSISIDEFRDAAPCFVDIMKYICKKANNTNADRVFRNTELAADFKFWLMALVDFQHAW